MSADLKLNAPEPLAPIAFDIPRPKETALENGLRIVIFEDKRLPLVSFRLSFFSGDINDPADQIGISSAMASLLTEGTEGYTSLQLAEKVERLGASVSANSSYDFTTIAASSLSLYNQEVLGLLAEVALRPSFPESELDLYRRNTIESLKFQRSQPGFLANERSARLIYGDHPYSRVSPAAEDIERLTREALSEFHRSALVPNNALLLAVGDVESEYLIREINENFGSWQPREVKLADAPPPPKRTERTLTIVDRPGSAQANIVIGNLAAKRLDDDYFSLLVMNQVLGAGASSRVFMNLREEKGYTYGAYTRIDAKRLTGDIEATAEVRTAVTGDSLKEFFYEFDRIRSENVSESELDDAKSFLSGVFPIRAETQEGLTNLILNQYLYGLPEDHLQTYRKHVNAVTADDVLNAANKYLRPDEMAIVIVGDGEDVLAQARGYSTMAEVFDTDGNSVDLAKYETVHGDTADVNGRWQLNIDFQGQQLPVTLSLDQDGENVLGELETMLGNGEIADGRVSGNKLAAVAKAKMQGQSVEFSIAGKVDGESMSGTITAPIVPDPLPFSGTRI